MIFFLRYAAPLALVYTPQDYTVPSVAFSRLCLRRYAAPLGIVYTVLATGVCGLLLILALLFSMQSIDDAIDGTSGNAAIQIISQTAGQSVATVFAWLLVVNIFFAGTSSITVTSRILFALCRDKATIFADTLSAVDPTFHSPLNAIVFLFFVQSLLLLIPLASDGGEDAFLSILSICVVGLQVSLIWNNLLNNPLSILMIMMIMMAVKTVMITVRVITMISMIVTMIVTMIVVVLH